jgi:uncharacterized protein YciI
MFNLSVVDILQSTGPIALNELVMRLPIGPRESVTALKKLQSEGRISISGPLAGKIQALMIDADPKNADAAENLTDQDILGASDTFIEPSASSWRRSLAS